MCCSGFLGTEGQSDHLKGNVKYMLCSTRQQTCPGWGLGVARSQSPNIEKEYASPYAGNPFQKDKPSKDLVTATQATISPPAVRLPWLVPGILRAKPSQRLSLTSVTKVISVPLPPEYNKNCPQEGPSAAEPGLEAGEPRETPALSLA